MPSFSFELKLMRAFQLMLRLRELTREHFETHPIGIEAESSAEDLAWIFKVRNVEPLDPEWSLVLGDVVHALRCSLDHLVYELAERRTGGLTESELNKPTFLVSERDDTEVVSSWGKRVAPILSPDAMERIVQLQPFNFGRDDIWGSPLDRGAIRAATFLPLIAALDNIDKHRFVRAGWVGVAASRVRVPDFPDPFKAQATALASPVEEGAEIGRWTFDETGLPSIENLDLASYFPIELRIIDRSSVADSRLLIEHSEVGAFLLQAWTVTASVIALFDGAVRDGDEPLPVTELSSIMDRPLSSWITDPELKATLLAGGA